MNKSKEEMLINNIIPVYLVALTILEICAFTLKGFFSVAASRIWAVTGIILLIYFLYKATTRIVKDFKENKYLLVAGFLVLFGIYCTIVFSRYYSDINPEASIQLADALRGLKNADWNYTGTGFLGYPAKQYILASVPSLFMGRNVFAAHLGFAYLFLIGFMLFFFESRNLAQVNGMPDYIALLPCAALSMFPYIAEYYRTFEQTIMPVTFSMICTVMYIRYVLKHDVFSILTLAFAGGMLSGSYTPALSYVPLLTFFLLMNAFGYWRKTDSLRKIPKHSVIPDFALITYITGCFIISLLAGRKDRATVMLENPDIVEMIKKSVPDFLTDRNARFFGVLLSISLIYIILSLTFRFYLYDFIISGWILTVSLFAHFLGGYAVSSSEAVIIQRCMVSIPVLVIAVYLVIVMFLSKNNLYIRKSYIFILYLFALSVSLCNFTRQHQAFTYLSLIRQVIPMINHIEETLDNTGLSSDDLFGILLYSDNTYIHNLKDYTGYYFPNAVCKAVNIVERDNILEDAAELMMPAFETGSEEKNSLPEQDIPYISSEMNIPVICLSQDSFETEDQQKENIQYIHWQDYDSLYKTDIQWNAAVVSLNISTLR